jgi:outer membrane protein assembly factor BamD (BamD/ComL family)
LYVVLNLVNGKYSIFANKFVLKNFKKKLIGLRSCTIIYMKYHILLLLIGIILSTTLVKAQSSNSNQKMYRNGKEYFEAENYELAMQTFSPLTRPGNNNPFVEYASFFYALSAYHADQKELARNMLLQISQKFPNWQDVDEARFWLAKIYFEEKEYNQAFEVINIIKNKVLKEEAQVMKEVYLNEIDDITFLKKLQVANPKDKDLALVLAEKIRAQPLVDQDQQLMQSLVKEYKLDPERFQPQQVGKSEFKEIYNIAVLMPFFTEEIAKGRSVSNQFVVDLYEGIQLGYKKLLQEGVSINLFAYDTRRDSATTASLLNMDEMRSMDLIIGPLYPVTSRLASAFSHQNRINMINPISNNSQVIGNNPYSFLFRPSFETQARKAAEFASKEFSNKNSIIIYGTTPRDSILAHTYKNEAERDGLQIVKMVKVGASDSKKVIDLISGSEENSINIPYNSIGHIYVTSLDEIIIANILNSLDTRTDKIAILGHEEWLDYRFLSYEQLERFLVYFIAPNYVDLSQPSAEIFRQKFIDEARTLPSTSAYSGYETILFAGKMLKRYGTYFQNELEKVGLQKGELFQGHYFPNSNDNQYVPILRILKSDLVVVNNPGN